MKKLLFTLGLFCIAISAFSQKDVTKFLGIPIDGTRAAMKQKLIKKGFTPKIVGGNEILEGEFNGSNVHIYIVTNKDKVYRIMVTDPINRNEAEIKSRFNNLVRQFDNNKRYTSYIDYSIADDVDISYEMAVNKKVFDAYFAQDFNYSQKDSATIISKSYEILKTKYSEEYIESHKEDLKKEFINIGMELLFDLTYKKYVWFKIVERYGEYFINIYYDNKYNEPNGEDL
ncbi:MAG: hypothetical protein SO131_06245 [Prevotella sp.]|nr:hypothetical protein [Prevotella sp.]MDY4891082.1 hypothetical protein [Prevotella sp.]